MKAEWEVRFQGFVMDRDEDGGLHQPAPDELEAFMDKFGLELEALDAAEVLISTTLSTGAVDVSLTVAALDISAALAVGASTIRTAFHAAGAATPGWSVDWFQVKGERSKDQPKKPKNPAAKRELVHA